MFTGTGQSIRTCADLESHSLIIDGNSRYSSRSASISEDVEVFIGDILSSHASTTSTTTHLDGTTTTTTPSTHTTTNSFHDTASSVSGSVIQFIQTKCVFAVPPRRRFIFPAYYPGYRVNITDVPAVPATTSIDSDSIDSTSTSTSTTKANSASPWMVLETISIAPRAFEVSKYELHFQN